MKNQILTIILGLLVGQALWAQEGADKFAINLDNGFQKFELSAQTARELNLKCKEYAEGYIRDVFGSFTLTNRSNGKVIDIDAKRWWKNRNELCSEISHAALKTGLPMGTPWRHLIQGLLQNSFEFVFYSDSKEEVRRQCELFLNNRAVHGPFDVANFSYNFGPLKYVETTSWWTETDPEFCQLIVDSLVD